MTSPTERERSSVVIGKDTTTNEDVRIDADARQHSMYIIGMRQYGKSNLLEHIAWADMASGDGLCFIDPLGKSADKLMQFVPEERREDVIFWDVAQENTHGFNPFFCPDRNEIDRKADEFLDLLHNLEEFHKAFESGNRMNEVIYNLAVPFLANQGSTMADARRFLKDKNYRNTFYRNLMPEYSETLQFWLDIDGRPPGTPQESYDTVLNKLNRFVRSRAIRTIFGQAESSIDFRLAMDEGKIIIVSLTDKIGREDAAFVGAYVIWDIARSMYQRTNRRPFHIIVDEFARYMTTTFSRLHDEGGNFGIDVIIAHQHRDQIEDVKIKGGTLAVGNKIIFRVSGKDATELSHEVDIRNRETATGTRQPIPAPVFDPVRHITANGTNNEAIQRCMAQILEVVLDKRLEFDKDIKLDLIRIFENNLFADEMNQQAPVSLIPAEAIRADGLRETIRQYLFERMCHRLTQEEVARLASQFVDYEFITWRAELLARFARYDFTTLSQLAKDILAVRRQLETNMQDLAVLEIPYRSERDKYYTFEKENDADYYRMKNIHWPYFVVGSVNLSLLEDRSSRTREDGASERDKYRLMIIERFQEECKKLVDAEKAGLAKGLSAATAEIKAWGAVYFKENGIEETVQKWITGKILDEEEERKIQLFRKEEKRVWSRLLQQYDCTPERIAEIEDRLSRWSQRVDAVISQSGHPPWGNLRRRGLFPYSRELIDSIPLQQTGLMQEMDKLIPVRAKLEYLRLSWDDISDAWDTQQAKVESLKKTLAMLERIQAIMTVLIALGDELERDPIETSSGKYEVINNPNTVWAEVANEIVQSPKYTAHCVIVQGDVPKHFIVKTLPPPDFYFTDEEKAVAIARGEELKRFSQAWYGQRGEDEEGLGLPIEPPDKNTPSPPQALEEDATEEEFDDGG